MCVHDPVIEKEQLGFGKNLIYGRVQEVLARRKVRLGEFRHHGFSCAPVKKETNPSAKSSQGE